MILIIFVFDPLAIAMVVAANMAFANIKGVARDPKDYEVYQPKVVTKEIIKEVPVEVEKEIIKEVPIEKIVEKEVIKYEKDPRLKSNIVQKAIIHAKRAGELD
jgi:hypothetical protein